MKKKYTVEQLHALFNEDLLRCETETERINCHALGMKEIRNREREAI